MKRNISEDMEFFKDLSKISCSLGPPRHLIARIWCLRNLPRLVAVVPHETATPYLRCDSTSAK